RKLFDFLAMMGTDVGFDFRASDQVDPRPKGMQLMQRLIDPKARSIGLTPEQVATSAEFYRGMLDGLRFQAQTPGEWEYFLSVIQGVGWSSDKATMDWVNSIRRRAVSSAIKVHRRAKTEELREYHQRDFELTMQKLSDLYALKAIEREAEQKISAVVEKFIASLSKDEPDEADRLILKQWQTLQPKP
ncbi:MAG: hypothetical protein AAGE59_11080, partial [Cyanobacteria bacterium P01_F01_bin.86]